jgi:hypothetical protein
MISTGVRRSIGGCTRVLLKKKKKSFTLNFGGYKAEKQRKGKNPNSKAAKTKSNQNHSNGTTAPSL